MAARYFKAGATTWNSANNWSATGSGGGDNAGVPTSADDVIFETGSGNCQINTNAVARSIDCTSGTGDYGGAITYDTVNRTITLGDGTAGAGNVILKFSAGMTYTISAVTNQINFHQTHSTQQSITWAGKTPGSISYGNTVTPSWIHNDGYSSPTSTVSHQRGTLNFNGQTFTFGTFTSTTSNTRTITLGAANITLAASGTVWNSATVTGLTMTANTATVTCTGANAAIASGTFDFNGMSVVHTGSATASLPSATCTFANVTRTGTAVQTDNLRFGGNTTITGTLTVNGDSAINRLKVFSNAFGTARTVTAGAVSASYANFQDITAAGAASWNLSAITGLSGDMQGNTGITFTTPATQTYAGGTFNWSNVAAWTSRIPLPQDDVIVNTTTAGTLTTDMPVLGKSVDFTSFTRTFAVGTAAEVYGNLTLSTGMTYSGTSAITLAGRSNYSLTTNGKTITSGIIINTSGGVYTLQDNMTNSRSSGSALQVANGTFDANDKDILLSAASGGFTMSAGTLYMGNGTWTASGSNAGAKWNVTGGTIFAESSTVRIAGNGLVSKTFIGGGQTYNKLESLTTNVPMTLAITGSNTFTTLEAGTGKAITFAAGSNNTITNVTVAGSDYDYVYLPNSSGNYISLPDSAALSIASDITVLVRVAMDDWTPAASSILLSKEAVGAISYNFFISTAGRLVFGVSSAGVARTDATSSASPVISDGSDLWVLASWRASDGRTQFFTASGAITNPASSDFSQLGTDQTANVGSLADTATPVEIGSYRGGTTSLAAAKFYRAKIYNGLFSTAAFGGSVQLDADLVGKTVGANTFTESSSNAATVTINGTLAQLGDGRVSFTSDSGASAATITSSTPGNIGVNSVSVSGNTGVAVAAGTSMNYLSMQDITWAYTPTGSSGKMLLMF